MKYWTMILSVISVVLCILFSVALIIPRIIESQQMDQFMGSLFDVIALSASLLSIALAIIAIWIAMYFKGEADTVNQQTQDMLVEIKTDAKAINFYAASELREYGTWARLTLTQSISQVVDDTLAARSAKSGEETDLFDEYEAKRTRAN